MKTKTKIDPRQKILNTILERMDSDNVLPWQKPWRVHMVNGKPVSGALRFCGKPYKGVNAFLLSILPYESPMFITYNQAKSVGGNVKKGEHGWPCTFYKTMKGEDAKTGKEKFFPMIKTYTVFNVSQCENLPSDKLPQVEEMPCDFNPVAEAERIISNMPYSPKISHGGSQAFYRLSTDEVWLPKKERFKGESEYYSTAFHELGHSTGHRSRLDRKGIMDHAASGSCEYSKEELVAELTACFLCSASGIKNTIDNSTAYINSWYSKLKDDKTLIFTAASRAQKAFDYITQAKEEPA